MVNHVSSLPCLTWVYITSDCGACTDYVYYAENAGAISGRHQEISQLSARVLTAPPPPRRSGSKVCVFTSGTRAGDIGYTTPYFGDAECNRSTLFPPIDT